MDFGDLRREEVINYCRSFYGEERVSRIITFGTLSAKAVIRDVSKILYDTEEDKGLGDRISKTIPSAPKMTITKALDESPEFKKFYDNDPKVKRIVDVSLRLEGLPKNVSQHACGVIISGQAVNELCPQVYLQNEDTGLKEGTTQFTMSECESIGLLKMDFLGLKTMSILQENICDINRIYGKNMTIDDIPINEPAVYNHIAKGHTCGVFQLESPGMTSFMVKLFQDVSDRISKIDNMPLSEAGKALEYDKLGIELYERLTAGISLYRPGPMDEIPRYIDCMLNTNHITYDTPELEEILKVTYGVLVYQEQVMSTVRTLAGFTKGQADLIRKAMGKKKEEILNEFENYFLYGSGDIIDSHTGEPLGIKGCVELGISEDKAKIIWTKMKKFAKYAFNKSHAAGYADVGIRTAWVSYHHPTIFMKGNLNIYINNPDKIKAYLAYCYKKGIKMLSPCVNESQELFTVVGKEEAIRFGLKGIKNVGKVSDLILNERKARGLFKDFQDFVERMITYQKISSDAIKSLIYSGALDSFEGTRRAKITIVPKLLDVAKLDKKATVSGQITMFDFAEEQGLDEIANIKKIPTPVMDEYDKDYKLSKEREFAGFYITEHPLDDYIDVLKNHNVLDISVLTDTQEMETESDEGIVEMFGSTTTNDNPYIKQTVSVSGIIKDLTLRWGKNNSTFYTFRVEDRTSEISAVCFANKVDKNRDKLVEGKKVVIKGEFDINDYGEQIKINSMIDLEQDSEFAKSITVISSSNIETARIQWKKLLVFTTKNEGATKINFVKNGELFKFPKGLNLTAQNLQALRNFFGESNCNINL